MDVLKIVFLNKFDDYSFMLIRNSRKATTGEKCLKGTYEKCLKYLLKTTNLIKPTMYLNTD
jgi:hypothetical protein